jgi:voltage-gated potassium channel
VLGGVIAILGIGLFALPAGILASGFSAQLAGEKKKTNTCPHCGKEIEAS